MRRSGIGVMTAVGVLTKLNVKNPVPSVDTTIIVPIVQDGATDIIFVAKGQVTEMEEVPILVDGKQNQPRMILLKSVLAIHLTTAKNQKYLLGSNS